MKLDKKNIELIIKEASLTGADYVEVFIEKKNGLSIKLLNGNIEDYSKTSSIGIGITIAKGYNSSFGHTNKITKESIFNLVKKLRAVFNDERKEITPLSKLKVGNKHKALIKFDMVNAEEKINLLKEAHNYYVSNEERVNFDTSSLTEISQEVIIAKMDGTYVKDYRNRIRFTTAVSLKENDRTELGYNSIGKSMGYEIFNIKGNDPVSVASEALRCARVNLTSKECPSGEMSVIVEGGAGGVLFHEAVAHSLEATSVAIGQSVFGDSLNKRIAHKCVSAVDDGTILNEWGSSTYDDEGHKQKRRVLIKNGILKSFMVDDINGRRMNSISSSSGRRQGYNHSNTSRMSNTFILNGKSSLEDMLKGIKIGLYAVKLGGGSVDPATGEFNFAVDEGYLIKDEKITYPVKGATLVGKGQDVLKNIDKVGDNLSLSDGYCGSSSGTIPVTVGQPRVRIKKITVGGSNHEEI